MGDEATMPPQSWIDVLKQWGPSGAAYLALIWIVVQELPAARKSYTDSATSIVSDVKAGIKDLEQRRETEIKEQRAYDREMRERAWKHDAEQNTKIADTQVKLIQTMDVNNKMNLELVYELKRLRETIDKSAKKD